MLQSKTLPAVLPLETSSLSEVALPNSRTSGAPESAALAEGKQLGSLTGCVPPVLRLPPTPVLPPCPPEPIAPPVLAFPPEPGTTDEPPLGAEFDWVEPPTALSHFLPSQGPRPEMRSS